LADKAHFQRESERLLFCAVRDIYVTSIFFHSGNRAVGFAAVRQNLK